MFENDIRTCQCCNKKIAHSDMLFTKDCHGITYRLVCYNCYKKLMAKGMVESIMMPAMKT